MIDDTNLPTPIDSGRSRVLTIEQLATSPRKPSGCRSRRAQRHSQKPAAGTACCLVDARFVPDSPLGPRRYAHAVARDDK
jgi:hypothetical protein